MLRSTSTLPLLACLALLTGPALVAEDQLKPTLVIEAELTDQSEKPKMEDIWVYREGLVLNEYKVKKVVEGSYKDSTILVTHWGVRRGLDQPVTKWSKGQDVTLKLKPFKDIDKLDEVYRSETIANPIGVVYHDVGQQIVEPEAGRWNYVTDVSRNMRAFHLLKNQLKLVVLGDCQGWFSNKTELHYGEENQQTPVALNLCQERSGIQFYQMMVDNYVTKLPKIEWVVIPLHTRWLNGRAKWRGLGQKTNQFKKSPGFKFDQQHAASVFAAVEHPPITLEQVLASEAGANWKKHPWGHLTGVGSNKKARKEASNRKPKYKESEQRWQQWEKLIKSITDADIKVLVYTMPIHPATGSRKVKDKNGTTEAGYNYIVQRNQELTNKLDGYFFYDFNNGGNNGMDDSHFANIDHCSSSGAAFCTEKVEAFRLECEKKAK